MSRRSNRCPVFLETTGCWGISPEMAQYILTGASLVESRRRGGLAGALEMFRRGLCYRPWRTQSREALWLDATTN